MTFNIVIARHPPVIAAKDMCYGQMELSLTDNWQACVQPFLSYVAQHHVDVIVSSPSKRCAQLSHLCAAYVHVPVIYKDALKEMNFGLWEGKTWAQIGRASLDKWACDMWDYQPPQGESVRMLCARVKAFWAELYRRRSSAVIVTHGGVIRILQSLAQKQDINPFRRSIPMGDFLCYHFEK